MRWLSGKGVCCQAGKPEFDSPTPTCKKAKLFCKLSFESDMYSMSWTCAEKKETGGGKEGKEKRKTEGIKTCICTEMLGTVKVL